MPGPVMVTIVTGGPSQSTRAVVAEQRVLQPFVEHRRWHVLRTTFPSCPIVIAPGRWFQRENAH